MTISCHRRTGHTPVVEILERFEYEVCVRVCVYIVSIVSIVYIVYIVYIYQCIYLHLSISIHSGNAFRYALVIKQSRTLPVGITRPLVILNPKLALSVHLVEYITPTEPLVTMAHANAHDTIPCRIMNLNLNVFEENPGNSGHISGNAHEFSELFPIPTVNNLVEYNCNPTALSFMNQYYNKIVLMCSTVKILYCKCYLEFNYRNYKNVSNNHEHIRFISHPAESKYPTELYILFEYKNGSGSKNECEIIISVDKYIGKYVLYTNQVMTSTNTPNTPNTPTDPNITHMKRYLDTLTLELNSELQFMSKARNCLYNYMNSTTGSGTTTGGTTTTTTTTTTATDLLQYITATIIEHENPTLYNPNTASLPISIEDVSNTILWGLLNVYKYKGLYV